MPDDEIAACPECDSHDIQTRGNGSRGPNTETAAAYWCRNCHATFDEPRPREAKRSMDKPTTAFARKVWEAGEQEAGGI